MIVRSSMLSSTRQARHLRSIQRSQRFITAMARCLPPHNAQHVETFAAAYNKAFPVIFVAFVYINALQLRSVWAWNHSEISNEEVWAIF